MTLPTTIACAARTARSTTTSTTSGSSRPRRGITILELLIVIALLIALGAMVLPNLSGVLEDRAFDAAADATAQQLVLARAHAQTSGRAVEVMYLPDPPRVIVREFEGAIRAASEGELRTMERRGEGEDALDVSRLARDDDGELAWSWAANRLPRDVRISSRRPAATSEAGAAVRDAIEARMDAASPEPPRPIRIAVFMSDGTALLGRPVWLIGGEGRAARLEVNPWTGLASLRREVAEAVEEEEAG